MLAVMLLSSIEFLHPKPSDLVLRVVPDVWARYWNVVCRLLSVAALAIWWKSDSFMHGQMESPNTSPQAIEPSYLGQAHSNRPGTGPGYKNMEPGSVSKLEVQYSQNATPSIYSLST